MIDRFAHSSLYTFIPALLRHDPIPNIDSYLTHERLLLEVLYLLSAQDEAASRTRGIEDFETCSRKSCWCVRYASENQYRRVERRDSLEPQLSNSWTHYSGIDLDAFARLRN